MNYSDAIIELFRQTSDRRPKGQCVCEAFVSGDWLVLPLEWNGAMHLADIAQVPVRIVDDQGNVTRAYPLAEQEHA